ncbi:MAG: hypothetical protein E7345_04745 [Clostridiales bacterium]|nr:hypothetical protein [Clostridiales bacterium]
MYLTKGYVTKKFETKEEIFNYIKQDLDQHKLSYKLVFKIIKKDIEIYVYQYHTLYMEMYMIHNDFDLSNRSINYDK